MVQTNIMRYIQRLNKDANKYNEIYTQRLNKGANKYNDIYKQRILKQRCKQIQWDIYKG